MKKALFILALLLSSTLVFGQTYPVGSSGGGGPAYDGGSVTNPVLAPTGCGATPGYAFAGQVDMGLCRSSADNLWIQPLQTGGVNANGNLLLNDNQATFKFEDGGGDVSNFTLNHGSGKGAFSFTDEIGITFIVGNDGTDDRVTSGFVFRAPSGTATVPSYSFSADDDMGFYRLTTNTASFSAGDVRQIDFGPNGVLAIGANAVFAGKTGSVTNPLYAFDVFNYGIFKTGSTSIGVSIAGTEELTVGANGISVNDGSSSLPGYSFYGDTNTGFARITNFPTAIHDGVAVASFNWEAGGGIAVFELKEDGIIRFEGATDDSNHLELRVRDPTTNVKQYLQDGAGDIPVYQTGTSTLTGGAATEFAEFALVSDAFRSGQVHTTTHCADATDDIKQRCEHDFICLNDGGTEGCGFTNSSCTTNAQQGTAGTISATTITADEGSGDGIVEFNYNVTCSLTETTLETFWNIEFEIGDWVAVTELN